MVSRTDDLVADLANATLGEEDAAGFLNRLDAFGESLPDRERSILAQLVVDALGEDLDEEPEPKDPPTEDELESFAAKLDRFHDELPGEQHLYVDDLLARTWFKDSAEVQGYGWRLAWRKSLPDRTWGGLGKLCFSRPGQQQLMWMHRPGGRGSVACFDWTEDE